jgi:hypothetical protein
MLDLETKQQLYQLYDILEDALDKLIEKRQADYAYRYACKKVEKAAINIRMAIDKFEANS